MSHTHSMFNFPILFQNVLVQLILFKIVSFCSILQYTKIICPNFQYVAGYQLSGSGKCLLHKPENRNPGPQHPQNRKGTFPQQEFWVLLIALISVKIIL